MRLSLVIVTVAVISAIVAMPKAGNSAEAVVYSAYRQLDLGNPGETPEKDYYVNIGSLQGVHVGSVFEVFRRTPTYDLMSEKLYKDVIFPIATLKVIHVEQNASVARLDKMLPADKTPVAVPNAVLVGDVVQISK